MTTPQQETRITIPDYMRKPESLARFSEILGGDNQARAYVQSVLILVAGDDKLQACTPRSIYTSAMRAATLGLSCDKSLKQAWLIPYNQKVKAHKAADGTIIPEHWESVAQFQPHYLGLHTLAVRTGKYWNINVSAVYDGQRVMENPLTGLHAIYDNKILTAPEAYNPANSQYTLDVTTRRRRDMKRAGWLGYFKTTKGFEKSIWMSAAEIDDHARKYVKDYATNPNWNDPEKREVMEMKTVFRRLMSWADLSGTENAKLAAALAADEAQDDNIIDVITNPSENPAPSPVSELTYEQAAAFVTKDNKPFGDVTDPEELRSVMNLADDPQRREAARLVLEHDFNFSVEAEAPAPKRTETENLKQLGY